MVIPLLQLIPAGRPHYPNAIQRVLSR